MLEQDPPAQIPYPPLQLNSSRALSTRVLDLLKSDRKMIVAPTLWTRRHDPYFCCPHFDYEFRFFRIAVTCVFLGVC